MKKEFLQHIAGLTDFFVWLQQKNPNISISQNQLIHLPENLGKKFAIGVPKRRIFGQNVFLACPTRELLWMNNILWERAVVFPEKRMLFLITKKINDNNNYTIPAFAIGFPFDNVQKAQIIAHIKKIEIKGYWKENNEIRIENGYRARMSVKRWEGVILEQDEISIDFTFSDMIKERINKTNTYINPGYSGDKNDLSRVDKGIMDSVKDLFIYDKDKPKK